MRRLHIANLCKGGALVGLIGPRHLVPRLLWERLSCQASSVSERCLRGTLSPQEQEQGQLTRPLYSEPTPGSCVRPVSLEFMCVGWVCHIRRLPPSPAMPSPGEATFVKKPFPNWADGTHFLFLQKPTAFSFIQPPPAQLTAPSRPNTQANMALPASACCQSGAAAQRPYLHRVWDHRVCSHSASHAVQLPSPVLRL